MNLKQGLSEASFDMRGLVSGVRSIRPDYGWVVIGVVFLGMAVGIGGTHYSFGLFVEPLEKEFGWNRTQLNASLSFAAVSSLVAPLIGRALDRFGARPVMAASILTLALTFGLRPLMENVWHWYLLSLVHFVAFPGATMLAGPKLVGSWFPRTRGRMMGVSSMGANFGGIILPFSIGALITATSWRWGFMVLGALSGLVGVLALLFVRERKAGAEPKDTAWESRAPLLASDRGATVREAFRSPLVYAMTIGTVAASFAYSAMLTQIIPHLEAEGLPKEQASAFLSLMAVFGMGGKVSFGYLTERLASRKVLSLSLFVQGICLVALITLPGYSALWLFAPILGLGFGGMGSALPILVQDTVGMRNFGTIYGFVTMATVSSSLLGPLLMGSVYDLRDSYAIGFVVVIVIYAVGILSLQAARPMPQASQMESGP